MPKGLNISRLANPREKHIIANEDAASAPPAPFPGLSFRLEFSGNRPSTTFDLTSLRRPKLADQAARLVWAQYQDGEIFSKGPVGDFRRVLQAFEAYLDSENGPPRDVRDFGDFDVELVDGFEKHIREHVKGRVPHVHMSALISLLRLGLEAGIVPKALERRSSYTSKIPREPNDPRDAYDDFTMAGLVKAAQDDVTAILTRLEEGRRLAALGRDPESESQGWQRPFNVLWFYINRGLPDLERRDWITAFYRNSEWPASRLSGLAFLRIVDLVPFLILLCHDNGLPVESNHELEIDCLENMAPQSGYTNIAYIKRRRHQTDELFNERVAVAKQFSSGWLVNVLRVATEATRRHLGYDENKGPLFVCFAHRRLIVAQINHYARQAWLRDHPVKAAPDGTLLDQLELARIRKSKKAAAIRATGGNIARVAKDHTPRVCLEHYVKIPLLRGRLDEAKAAGISKALAAATPIKIVDANAMRAAREGDQGVARRLEINETQLDSLADGTSDVIVAGCTGFRNSPYAEPGKPCGAPLFGCLDCKNSVFTGSRLPNLLTLLNYFVEQRQQMNLDVWRQNFGFAFARALQIVRAFPPADVEAAMVEIEDGAGREWTFGQLIARSAL